MPNNHSEKEQYSQHFGGINVNVTACAPEPQKGEQWEKPKKEMERKREDSGNGDYRGYKKGAKDGGKPTCLGSTVR